eukprot:4912040-Pleurochrysis_carterae.AAC.7
MSEYLADVFALFGHSGGVFTVSRDASVGLLLYLAHGWLSPHVSCVCHLVLHFLPGMLYQMSDTHVRWLFYLHKHTSLLPQSCKYAAIFAPNNVARVSAIKNGTHILPAPFVALSGCGSQSIAPRASQAAKPSYAPDGSLKDGAYLSRLDVTHGVKRMRSNSCAAHIAVVSEDEREAWPLQRTSSAAFVASTVVAGGLHDLPDDLHAKGMIE